jgi:hypothetical protein
VMRDAWRRDTFQQPATDVARGNENTPHPSRTTRHAPLLLTLLALCACGFQPVHGTQAHSPAAIQSLAGLEIRAPSGRLGEQLKADIEDGINPEYQSGTAQYRLDLTLEQQEIAQFINPDGTASRGNIRVTSTYRLVRLADNQVISAGTLHRSGSFDSEEQANYATYISREDARRRAVADLANDYRLRLINLSGAPAQRTADAGLAGQERRPACAY